MTDTQEQTTLEPQRQISTVDGPMERKRIGDISVDKFAGLTFREYREVIGFCQLVSGAKHGLPAFLRDNAPDCVIIATDAIRWRLNPTWVMKHSYITKAEGIVNHENFVFSAIIAASGLLKGRPRYRWDGEGENRTCTVTATFIGENEPHEYTTPPLARCRPRRNDRGEVKGSPLWDTDPDQQLGYYAIRSWGRRYMPEILGGVYARDEFEDSTQEAVDVGPSSPNLMDRLPAKLEGTKGFQENIVDVGLKREAILTEQLRQSVAAENKRREAAGEPPGATADEGDTEMAPQAKEATPEPPKPPATPGEYQVYAMAWIDKVSDPDNLEARWDGEKDMRVALGIPVAMRKMLEAGLRAKLNQVRKAKK